MRLAVLHKKGDDTDEDGAQVDHRQVDVFLIPVPVIREGGGWRCMELHKSYLLRGLERVTSLCKRVAVM